MKVNFLFLLVFFAATIANSQTKRTEDAIWWEIADKCLKESGIDNHNALFLSYDNEHFAGSIYKKRLNSVGRMLHPILLFDYAAVAKVMPAYPEPVYKEISKPCDFKIEDSKEHQKDLVGVILNKSNLKHCNAEVYAILSSSAANNLSIKKWGICEIKADDFENNLQENKKTDFAKETRNGERYIALKAIWLETIELTFKLSPGDLGKITQLYADNKETFESKGLFVEEGNLTIQLQEKYYPFLIFGEITKIMGLKSFQGIVVEPDFNRYNNLIRYKSK